MNRTIRRRAWRRPAPTDINWWRSGFAGKILRAEFFGPPPAPPAGGQVKVRTGSAWAEKPVRVWSGTAWVTKPVKHWTGTAWVLA